MRIEYKTTPMPQYINHIKTVNMKRARTEYICPSCGVHVRKRDFEKHVVDTHKNKADEVFAKFYGLQFPVKCSCGRELHYSPSNRGFPTSCGLCVENDVKGISDFRNSSEATSAIEKMEKDLAEAKRRKKELEQEEALEKLPLDQLPFPSAKYKTFMKRLALTIRVKTLNGEKDKLMELATFIENKLR